VSTTFKLKITPGYSSLVDEDWTESFVESLIEKPDWDAIKEIALNRLFCPEYCRFCKTKIDDFANYIIKKNASRGGSASGGRDCREIKEILQKAYLIWIIEETAKRRMNINIKFETF
jgi:hypothetical protein